MIYLDTDGVFAKWESYVVAHHLGDTTMRELNAMPSQPRSELIRSIYEREPDLFYNLDPIPEMGIVITMLKSTNADWYILTTGSADHPDPERVAECKKRWWKDKFDVEGNIIVVKHSGEKAGYAGPGKLLLDDYGKTCREWALRGGYALWVKTEEPKPLAICTHIQNFLDEPTASGSILRL